MTIFLETKRLILKTPELSDLDILTALRSDVEVMKYTGEGGSQTKEQVKEYLDFAISYFKQHGMGFCLVFEKSSGEFIGEAGVFHLLFDDTQPDIEIGFHLHHKFWGKGYATELAKALIQWAFQHLSTSKLVSATYSENTASQKVLKKTGFDYKGKKQLPNGNEIFWYEIYKNDSIELVSYDEQWPELAKNEIKILQDILPKKHILDIQHIGSTAIPGMLSKPIIDIQIAVDSLVAIKQTAIDLLAKQGYVYWDEDPDPEKMFFVKGMPPFGDKRTHHIHIIEPKATRWKNRILFRDYLIKHPDMIHEYENLKMKFAKEYTYDREGYTLAKTTFVEHVLQKAQEKYDSTPQKPAIIFLTGASGAGKTTLLNAFKNETSTNNTTPSFHFDDIGVPSESDMNEIYGSGSEWQKAMTYHWIKRLITDYKDNELVILEGQVNLDFIVNAFTGFNFINYKIILVHCDNDARHKRLHQDRNQPELINENMDNWSEFLKKQAIAKNVDILDTTLKNMSGMILFLNNQIKTIIK